MSKREQAAFRRPLSRVGRGLKVIKTDGSKEEYLHTKVVGTFNKVLADSGQPDIAAAEQLAEAVTYFIYNKIGQKRSITSSEIFCIIKASLTDTEYVKAAIALSDYHCRRRLNRDRIEVVSVEVASLKDAELLCIGKKTIKSSRWDKSRIVNDLIAKHNLERQTARMIGSMVEQKVLGLGVSRIPVSLIKQLVLGDMAAVLQAEKQLASV